MALRQSVLSTEYIRVDVEATVSGTAYDPTSDAVQFAFTLSGADPAGGDWVTGSWETLTNQPGTPTTRYYAICLVGPSGTKTLTVGDWTVWVKITDSPEIPVRQVGILTIS